MFTITDLKKRIEALVDNFQLYVDLNNKIYRPDTPSRHFHIRTVNLLCKAKNYDVFNDTYLDYVYMTLVAWGMENRKAKLVEFKRFKESIINNRKKIIELNGYNLRSLSEVPSNIEEVNELTQDVFTRLNISATNSKLVANTKTLHHFVPSLIPPVDRKFTLRFFFNNKNVKPGDKSISQFNKVLEYYVKIYEKIGVNIENMIQPDNWNSSVTKIIDNAIIGYWLAREPKK